MIARRGSDAVNGNLTGVHTLLVVSLLVTTPCVNAGRELSAFSYHRSDIIPDRVERRTTIHQRAGSTGIMVA